MMFSFPAIIGNKKYEKMCSLVILLLFLHVKPCFNACILDLEWPGSCSWIYVRKIYD